jgi:hypothetical protein
LIAKDVKLTATEQGKAVVNASKTIAIDARHRSEIDLLGNPTSIEIIKFEGETTLRKISEANKSFLKRIF